MKKFFTFLFIIAMVCLVLCSCGEHVHAFGEWTITKKATCTEAGEQERLCSCGERQTQAIPMTEHTPVTDPAIPATCTATGLTEGSHCSVCGVVLTKQNETPKDEHTWDSGIITSQPTCTETGVKTYTCSVCETTKTESIDALGHKWDSGIVTQQATCTETGIKTYTCSVCETTKTESIDALGHKWNSGIVTSQPTCTETGVKTYTCSVCETTKTTSIPVINHKWDSRTVTLEPTCTEKGVETLTCSVCGTTTTESIDALGHNPDSSGKCTRCGIYIMNMTYSEEIAANKVKSMSHDVTTNYSTFIEIYVKLKDSSGNSLKVPAYVSVRIENSLGVTVYNNILLKKSTEDYVRINKSDITAGESTEGTIYYTVYNTGYFNSKEFSKSTGNTFKLPWTVKVTLPDDLPKTITYYNYNNTRSRACLITNITYEVKDDDLYIYFTGEKTYDEEGSNYSSACYVGWKLYDSEGYIVASGNLITNNLAIGEKFKNERTTAWNCITLGESYRLEILDIR